jgi:hypothetical protein
LAQHPACPARRLVWNRIWAVLSDFFVEVGCHKNLQVAMYAVDSLRQLATKFLERDELANYSFQNDFLKPFVVVMRLSRALEIRELIIRCAFASMHACMHACGRLPQVCIPLIHELFSPRHPHSAWGSGECSSYVTGSKLEQLAPCNRC